MRKRHPAERLISRPTNCQAERSSAERAIAKLHSTSQAGEIRKKAKPVREAGSQLIADMHRNPATFAKRCISGNTMLVARLAKALTVAAIPEFRSKQDAEKPYAN